MECVALKEGPCSCGGSKTIRQHRHRHLQTLDAKLRIVQKDRRCSGSEDCPNKSVLFRPVWEQRRLIVKGCEYGLDVIALIGERHVQDHHSFHQIHKELTEKYGLVLSVRHVPNLFRLFLAMVGARTLGSQVVRARLEAQGPLILSADAVRFDDVSPPLYVVREVNSGEVLVAERIETADTKRLVKFLSQVRTLDLPIAAIVSDNEKALIAAIAEAFPEIPHQYCHTHFLGNLVKPMESDLAALGSGVEKVAKKLRQFEKLVKAEEIVDSETETSEKDADTEDGAYCADFEDDSENDADAKDCAEFKNSEDEGNGAFGNAPEKHISENDADSGDGAESKKTADLKEQALVKTICKAARIMSKGRGDKILNPSSLKRFNDLEDLENRTRKAVERKGGEWPLLNQLLAILALLSPLVGLARRLQRQVEIVRQIAHLLNLETSGKWVERRFATYLKKLEKEAPQRGKGAERGRFHEHVIELSRRYWKGLFHCYDIDGLPNNNNEMESFFGTLKSHDRRVRGNKSNSGGPLESFGPYIVQIWGNLQGQTSFLELLLKGLSQQELQLARDAIQDLAEPARARRSFVREPAVHLKSAIDAWLGS